MDSDPGPGSPSFGLSSAGDGDLCAMLLLIRTFFPVLGDVSLGYTPTGSSRSEENDASPCV